MLREPEPLPLETYLDLLVTCDPKCMLAYSSNPCRCICRGKFHGTARGPVVLRVIA